MMPPVRYAWLLCDYRETIGKFHEIVSVSVLNICLISNSLLNLRTNL